MQGIGHQTFIFHCFGKLKLSSDDNIPLSKDEKLRSRLNFFRRKFFLRLTGEEKGFSPEKWRKLEKNGENSNEF